EAARVGRRLIAGAEFLQLQRRLTLRRLVEERERLERAGERVVEGVRRLRGCGGGGAVDPAALPLVLPLAGTEAARRLAAPAVVWAVHAMRIEKEDGVAERALARAPALARCRIELLVRRGEERPVDGVQNQRLAGAVLADDG